MAFNRGSGAKSAWLSLGMLWTVFACLIGLVLFGMNRAFSLFDESYYANLFVDPARFQANLHPYGFLIHVIFVALGRSVIALRLFGFAVVVVTGVFLGRATKRYFQLIGAIDAEAPLPLLGAIFSLTIYTLWCQTVNYNMQAAVSGTLLLAGLFHWLADDVDTDAPRDWLASITIGFAGCLAFLAKAPFASLCAVLTAAVLVATVRRRGFAVALQRAGIVAVSCIVPLVVILQSTIGIPTYLTMLRAAVVYIDLGNSPLFLPVRTVRELLASAPIVYLAVAALIASLAIARSRKPSLPYLRAGMAAVLALAIVYLGARFFERASQGSEPSLYIGMPTIAIAIAWLAFALCQRGKGRPAAAVVLPLVLLAVFPLITAYGTASPLWVHTGITIYATLMMLTLVGRIYFAPVVACSVEVGVGLYTAALLVTAALLPYATPGSLFSQTEPVQLPFARDTLLVDPMTRDYIAFLRDAAARGKLEDDTPVMDLSGGGPGTALFLNNRAPFFPWVLPMYATSERMADSIWNSMTDEQRRRAWIVVPIDRAFANSRVSRDWLARKAQYQLLGTHKMNFQVNFMGPGQSIEIELWKPIAATPEVH